MKYITNFEFVSWYAAKDSKRNFFHFYAAVTQYTSIYKCIQMTGSSNWNIIIDTADYVFVIWPIC